MPPEVRVLVTDEERATAMALRFEVFVDEQRVPAEEEHDRYDAGAVHFGAFVEGRLQGCLRLIDLGEGIAKIGRVAVRASLRGDGLGRALMERALDWWRERGGGEAVLDAQCAVIAFYERVGFTAEGEVFLDAGIEHRRMRRALGPPRV